jgi:hypothetical protein
LLEVFFTPDELLEALCAEAEPDVFAVVDLLFAVPLESCPARAGTARAQLKVSAQAAPKCALRIINPLQTILPTFERQKKSPADPALS